MEICTIGDPRLRQKTLELTREQLRSSAIQDLIDALIATMRSAHGAGIAAPQVGEPWRIFVVEVNQNPRYPYKPPIPLTVVVNPEIYYEKSLGTHFVYEGCLSVPNMRGKVQRYLGVRLKGWDRYGQIYEQEYRGLSAATIQHEYDHLNGVMFIDKVEDVQTLSDWDNYDKYHAKTFAHYAESVVLKYESGANDDH